MKIILFSIATLALILIPHAAADFCHPTTSRPTLATPTCDSDPRGSSCFYVDSETCRVVCDIPIATAVYEEANGIPGLQREDAVKDDTCGGIIPGDRFILLE